MRSITARRQNNKRRGGAILRRAAVLAFWCAVWEILSLIVGSPLLLPSPWTVLKTLASLIGRCDFWLSLAFTGKRLCGGYLLAFAAAFVGAVTAARFSLVRTALSPFVSALKSVPVASFVILALIWLSPKSLSVFVSFVMVFPILYTNLLAGIDACDEKMLEMAHTLGISAANRALYIYFPTMFPYLRSALSLSLGLCLKAGIAAELIGIPNGSVGEQLYFSKVYFQTSELFAWTVVIVLVGILFEKLIIRLIDSGYRRFERM